MNILHLYKDYHPILGGIENHIKMLAEAQAAAGHQVTVLVTNPARLPERESINGVQVVRVPRLATVASTPLTIAFLGELGRHSPDIIHLQFPYPIGEISQLVAGRGRPFVISYQSDIVRGSQQAVLKLYRPILKQVLRKASRILASSQNYIHSSPYLQEVVAKCAIVPLGIDPAPFTVATPLVPKGEIPVLIFVGRHRYYKGLDDLIRAMPEIQAELLVGGDGPLRLEWERLAGELGVREKIRFLGDIPRDNLPGLYASGDVFILPSNLRAEAYGLVLLEAMASGLPCITTELGTGTSYIVQNEVTGLVVPPRDPNSLAQAANRLLTDVHLRRKMGAAGRERIFREFTLERMVNRIQKIYADILNPA